ncbi:MAG: F0F1 ATP synthase subunit epsilon [Clostridiaceae bacterium]
MADKFKLTIVTPDKEFFSGEAEEVIIGEVNGPMAILANHINSVVALKPYITEYIASGTKFKVFTSSGTAKVINNEVTLVVDACENPEEIDVNRAKEAKTRAEERLSKHQEVNVKRAEAALLRSVTRIKASER